MIKVDLKRFSMVNIPEKRLTIFISLSCDAQLAIDILDVLLDYIYYGIEEKQVQDFLKKSDKVKIIYWDNFEMTVFNSGFVYYINSVPKKSNIKNIKECFKK